MNVKQCEHIEEEIKVLATEDPQFDEALERDRSRHESLFVKNLENVQGDERDVIFISMTYAPPGPGQKVKRRFGPINSDTGWRRLNVLYTRAKKKMRVFSSMNPEFGKSFDSWGRGVRALYEFLAYCESGRIPKAPKDEEVSTDHFQAFVTRELNKEGFATKLNYGTGQNRIALAVESPDNPDSHLMAIEADGMGYLSSKSTRDRDRLRPAMLERMGWRTRTIWASDFFQNPKNSLAPIVDELKAADKTFAQQDPVADAKGDAEATMPDTFAVESPGTEAFLEGTLSERLVAFDAEVIRKEIPETPDHRRLLRPAMIEALEEYMPVNRGDFLGTIPQYLRTGTAPTEAKFLDQVLDIINLSS